MRRARAFLVRLGDLFLRGRRERELAAELDAHLQLHIDDNLRAGMTPAEARRRAVLALGGVEQTKERVREARRTWLDALGRDLAFALRTSVRRRWHVAAIVVMLAAGIAGSTAVFSFLYQILLQPLGIANPSRLAQLDQTTPPRYQRLGVTVRDGYPYEGMKEQRAQNPAFAAVGMAASDHLALLVEGQEAQRVNASFASAGYFEALGVRLRSGRSFRPADESPADPVAIVSDRLRARILGGDDGLLGRGLRLNGRSCRIVGVAPAEFAGHQLGERVDVWLPWGSQAAFGLEPVGAGLTVARLRDGVTLAQAADLAAAISDRYLAALPADRRDRVGELRLKAFEMNRGQLLASLLPHPWLLLTGPLLMLLLACANVANLQLADGESRRREFASRSALGASRPAILRQVLSEALVPGLAACALGLLLAFPCMALLQRVPTQSMKEPWLTVVLQPQAMLFAASLALLSVVLTGTLPAVRAAKANLADVIRGGPGVVPVRGRLTDVLIVLQVGLALMLVTTGVLVGRSLDAARRQDLGLRPDGVIGIRLQFGSVGGAGESAARVQRLLDGARALPGVRVATVSPGFPLEGVVASVVGDGDRGTLAALVGTDYFATIGVKVLAGRDLGPEDDAPGVRTVVVNESLAKAWWPGLDPVGRLIGRHRVVGVVTDHASFPGVDPHAPAAFEHLTPERIGMWPCLLVRTDGDPRILASSLIRLVREVDPAAPILRVATLREHLDGLHHHLRVASWLLGLCAVASLALAALGVHSLLAYRVTKRRKEIGLRMALGAARLSVVRMIVARLAGGVAVGLAAGGLGAFVLSRVFGSLFTGAAALDVSSLLASAMALVLVALAAAAAPSYRATRVDPATTLRGD